MTNIKEIIQTIEKEYPTSSLSRLSMLTGISVYKIKNIIKNNNLKLKKERKVSFENFENITKKEVAYFLGFFWSDGYISKDEITLSIKESDSHEILSILNSFGKWRINYYNKKLNNKIYNQACIRVNDKYIKDFLIENNFLKKSLISPSKILTKIPENIKNYFFRGLIDGDGCFSSKKRSYFSITGNIDQDWSEVINFLNSLNIKYKLTKKERNSGNSSYIVISSKIDILKLGNYIYGDNFDNIGLKRKYKIYEEIKNKPTLKNKGSKHINRFINLSFNI